MPTEVARTMSRKPIKLPSDDIVWIPVIETITFKDHVKRAQENQWKFDNTPDSSRTGHSFDLHSSSESSNGDITIDSDGTPLKVERTDFALVKDPVNRGQETNTNFINNDPPPAQADAIGTDPQHRTVHYVRYCKDNDRTSPIWIDTEVIDEAFVKDHVDRGQETDFTLTNNPVYDGGDPPASVSSDPFNPIFAECDMTLPIADYSTSDTIDPPYRLDPFQNIVNFSAGATLQIFLNWSDWVFREQNTSFNSWAWMETTDLQLTITTPVDVTLDSDTLSTFPFEGGQVGVATDPVPSGWNGQLTGNAYFRVITYKVPSLASGQTIKFSGTLTGDPDRQLPYWPGFSQGSINTVAAGPTETPYPLVNVFLQDSGGAVANCITGTTFLTTGPQAQDAFAYPAWTDWHTTGIFSGGNEFEVSIKNISLPTEKMKLIAWFSKPLYRTINNIFLNNTLQDSILGWYTAFGSLADGTEWLSDKFMFGGEPNDSNKYPPV